MIEEHADYYDEFSQTWINVVILQFDGDDAIVRNSSGKYVRIPITKLQH